MQARSCPRCGAGLDPVSVGDVKVDGCSGCGGVWFDHQELTALARTQAAQLAGLEAQFQPAAASTSAATGMGCPACGVSLRGFEFPHAAGIPLHGCERCHGIWVDDGELQAIHGRLQAVQAGAATCSSPAPSTAVDKRQKARQAAGFIAYVECPGCRQPNPVAGAVCWACGACLQGERAFLCPRCDHPLADRVELGVLLNVCNHCGGLWLDHGELKKLIRQSPAELRRLERELGVVGSRAVTDLDREHRLFCPDCHVPIHGRRYAGDSGVFINSCECCQGAWVDAAELTTVAEMYAES